MTRRVFDDGEAAGATHKIVPSSEAVAFVREELEAIATRFGGEHDGWEAEVVTKWNTSATGKLIMGFAPNSVPSYRVETRKPKDLLTFELAGRQGSASGDQSVNRQWTD